MALHLPGLIRRLSAHDVAFVVIGGIATTLHGSAHVTYDVDIVYQRTPEKHRQARAVNRQLDAAHDGTAVAARQ